MKGFLETLREGWEVDKLGFFLFVVLVPAWALFSIAAEVLEAVASILGVVVEIYGPGDVKR